jgi:hypothetical protein
MRSRAPRSVECQPHHQSSRPSCPSGTERVGQVDLIKVLSGYHAADPGGGIRIHDKDVPVKSPVHS